MGLDWIRSRPVDGLTVARAVGGDRDRAKRPKMASIAERLADRVFLTSDNPRSEDPNAILDEIAQGFSNLAKSKVQREVDRRRAIQNAIAACRPGDVLVIAGKGHENYQHIGSEKLPFSDSTVALESLKDRKSVV